jgi:hypothetical protein
LFPFCFLFLSFLFISLYDVMIYPNFIRHDHKVRILLPLSR